MLPIRFAVIGDPIAHSRSPAMFQAAFRDLGLPHSYERKRVRPDELQAAFDELRDGSYGGYNVTLPHKVRCLERIDRVDASAALAGAVNTVARGASGDLVGFNTDVAALVAELRALSESDSPAPSEGRHAVVIGGGGAARAAIVALSSLSCVTIDLRVRRPDDPQLAGEIAALVDRLNQPGKHLTVTLLPIEATSRDAEASFIVQATSAGMAGGAPGTLVASSVAWDQLRPGTVALDVVYSPAITPFLAAAQRAVQIRFAGGLGMLARQAALSFERWLGKAAPLSTMLGACQDPTPPESAG